MSYVDDDRRGRHSRDHPNPSYPPYPDHHASTGMAQDARGRPPPGSDFGSAADHFPPPPIGETLKPALKREGSRNRLPPDSGPQFPDEASYLGGRAPDLEAKNRPRDKKFRDLRDGYESDEGEAHKGSRYTPRNRMPRRPTADDDDLAYDDRKRRPRRDDPPPESMVSGRTYDDAPPPRRSRRDRDRDPPPYDDDYPPPRRRGSRPPPSAVEYGAEPIPARVKSERRPRPRRDHDDYSDDEYDRPRRPRSADDRDRDRDRRRRPRDYDDAPYYSDEPRRRRDEYGPPSRRDRSRRRHDDDYDDYDDRRDGDRRNGKKQPKQIKVGNFDIGPWVEKGQKHWTTIAPIVTPLVLNYIRKKGQSGGSGGGGGGGGRR